MQAAVAEAITGLHRTERRRQKRTTDRKGQLWIQPKVRRQTAARRLPVKMRMQLTRAMLMRKQTAR